MLAFRADSDGWLACWLEKLDSIKAPYKLFCTTLIETECQYDSEMRLSGNYVYGEFARKRLGFPSVVEIKHAGDCFALWNLSESKSGASQGNQNQTHSSKDPDYDRIDEGKTLERKFNQRSLGLAQYDARHPMEQQRAENHQ